MTTPTAPTPGLSGDCMLLCGDALTVLKTLANASVQLVVTSPPYFGLRSYLPSDHLDKALELGTETSLSDYVAHLVTVFDEVRRVLRPDGLAYLNLGDSYASAWAVNRVSKIGLGSLEHGKRADRPNRLVNGLKEKDLMGVPWRVAFALQDAGWYLRSDLIWAKPAPMPESVTDRCTSSHEYVFMLAKSERYYYNAAAIAEPVTRGYAGSSFTAGKTLSARDALATVSRLDRVEGETRNRRDVWTVATQPYPGAHYAVMPPKLVEPCILAGSRVGDTVLDPFSGAGTVGMVALSHGRRYIGIDLDERNLPLAEQRIGPMLLAMQGVAS